MTPLIIEPVEKAGQRSGVWSQLHAVVTYGMHNVRTVCGCSGKLEPHGVIQPYLAKDREDGDDSVVTMHLREEPNWSDGGPFPADEVLSCYPGIAANDESFPAKPAALRRPRAVSLRHVPERTPALNPLAFDPCQTSPARQVRRLATTLHRQLR